MSIPNDFNWQMYIYNYVDLYDIAKTLPSGHDKQWAETHYINHGKREGRIYNKPTEEFNINLLKENTRMKAEMEKYYKALENLTNWVNKMGRYY